MGIRLKVGGSYEGGVDAYDPCEGEEIVKAGDEDGRLERDLDWTHRSLAEAVSEMARTELSNA